MEYIYNNVMRLFLGGFPQSVHCRPAVVFPEMQLCIQQVMVCPVAFASDMGGIEIWYRRICGIIIMESVPANLVWQSLFPRPIMNNIKKQRADSFSIVFNVFVFSEIMQTWSGQAGLELQGWCVNGAKISIFRKLSKKTVKSFVTFSVPNKACFLIKCLTIRYLSFLEM